MTLTEEELERLQGLTRKGTASARTVRRAQTLLLAERVVELQVVPDITDEATRLLLNRTSSSPGSGRRE